MNKLIIFLVVVLLGLQLQTDAQKYNVVADSQLVVNPTIIDLDGDDEFGQAIYCCDYFWGDGQSNPEIGYWDQAVSHTDDGSGSWRMGPEIGGENAYGGRCAFGDFIPVKAGDELLLTIYAKATRFPAPTFNVTFSYWDKNYNSYWTYGDVQDRIKGDIDGTFTKEDEWQEFVVHTTIVDTTIAYATPDILFETGEGTSNDILDGVTDYSNYGYVYIDDVRVYRQRIGFNELPSPKNSFDGEDVKVDNHGNITINKDGAFEDFFPMAVCGAGTIDDRMYLNQGFNMEARAWDVDRARAVAGKGMYYGYDLSNYIDPDQGLDLNGITDEISSLKSYGILDSCIFYYIDNETINNYQRVKDVVAKIRAVDTGRPVYMLCGMFPEDARRYANDVDSDPLINMAGAYVGNGEGSFYDGARRLIIGNNLEHLTVPFNMAQIQVGVGEAFRATLFAGIANGAKGFLFWKDKRDEDPPYAIENYPWWDNLPAIKSEINQMMNAGIIQAPEADWGISLSTDTVTLLEWSARDVNDKHYLFLSNLRQTSSYDGNGDIVLMPQDVSTTVTINGLNNIGTVKDFFTGEDVTSVSGNSFDVTLPANTAVVYELSEKTMSVPVNDKTIITASPVPAKSYTFIHAPANDFFVLYNLMGEKLQEGVLRKGDTELDLSDLPPGIYLLKTGSGDTVNIPVCR